MANPFTIGPFDVTERLGSGGMADVWRGTHGNLEIEVAIKTLKRSDALFCDLLEREVQSMGLLSHPNVAAVLDLGTITEANALTSRGLVEPGAPYIVMQLVDGPNLNDLLLEGRLGWFEIKTALLCVLDGLAHAHSRGLIHRDVKPENVLTMQEDDARRYLLADFGVAQALATSDETAAGTPVFMAPEQFMGHWRDYGPATDVYSLGCMAYVLTAQYAPFDGASPLALAVQHTGQEPLPWDPKVGTPSGFEAWMLRCLAKHPSNRFPSAAAAAVALAALGDPSADETLRRSASMVPVDPESAPTIMMSSLGATVGPTMGLDLTDLQEVSIAIIEGDIDSPILGVPLDWRADESDLEEDARQSTSLFGIRRIPVVAREDERDAIWAEFYSAAQDKTARAVVLEGGSGTGKSVIARWMVERVEELGLARRLDMISTADGSGRPLIEALIRHFRCEGLEPEALYERLCKCFQPFGIQNSTAQAVATLFLDSPESAGLGASKDLEVQIARQILLKIAKKQRLVVWIDDAQRNSKALKLAKSIVSEGSGDIPIFLLLTVQLEESLALPQSRAQINELIQSPRVRNVTFAPFTELDTGKLVGSMLGLDSRTLQTVVKTVGGSPLYAVQLVRSWVEQGVLVQKRKGWRLKDGVVPELPDSLHDLWATRVHSVFSGLGPNEAVAVEIAAAIGGHVTDLGWEACCALAQTDSKLAIINQIVEGGLAYRSIDGWSFVHGMCRDSVIRSLKDKGRYPAICERAAQVLVNLYGDQAQHSERVGELLVGAQEWERAVPYLFRSLEVLAETSRVPAAKSLLNLVDSCLAEFDADPRTLMLQRFYTIAATPERRSVEGIAKFAAIAQECLAAGWLEMAANAMVTQARGSLLIGELGDSKKTAHDALAIFHRIDAPLGTIRAHLRLGDYQSFDGSWEESVHEYERAAEIATSHGIGWAVAWSLWGEGHVRLQQLRLEEAADLLSQSYDKFLEAGQIFYAISVLASMADVARFQGDCEYALTLYFEAYEAMQSLGIYAVGATLNIATGYVFLNDRVNAKKWIDRAEADLKENPRENYSTFIIALELADVLEDGRAEDASTLVTKLRESIQKSGMYELDLGFALTRAARASTRFDSEQTQALCALAVEVWDRLGHSDRADEFRVLAGA